MIRGIVLALVLVASVGCAQYSRRALVKMPNGTVDSVYIRRLDGSMYYSYGPGTPWVEITVHHRILTEDPYGN